MKSFKGYIFDIDGTLASTNELIFKSFNHITQKYLSRLYTDKEIISLFGPPEDVILKQLFTENLEEASRDYYTFYQENHKNYTSIFSGMDYIISSIKESERTLGIFTGKGRRTSEITLRELALLNYFDLIVTGDDVKNHKPHPEGIINFLEKFNFNPPEVLMIGDSPSDISAAKEAGVYSAALLWDCYAKDEIRKFNADYYFDTLNEFEEFILETLRYYSDPAAP